jgi:hypothetical protein
MEDKNGNYESVNFENMNDKTLAAACHLLVEGRQYENIEDDKDLALKEVSRRLGE